MRRTLRPLCLYAIAVLTVTLPACRSMPRPEEAGEPIPPVDTARITSVEEVASWLYRQTASVDLDGNGEAERVVIAADVEVGRDGVPLWEDGHRWAVYVEPDAGERTLLYGAFVPNGFAEAVIVAADDVERPRVLVLERTPQRIRAVEVEYDGPGLARSVFGTSYQVDQWLPGGAALPTIIIDE